MGTWNDGYSVYNYDDGGYYVTKDRYGPEADDNIGWVRGWHPSDDIQQVSNPGGVLAPAILAGSAYYAGKHDLINRASDTIWNDFKGPEPDYVIKGYPGRLDREQGGPFSFDWDYGTNRGATGMQFANTADARIPDLAPFPRSTVRAAMWKNMSDEEKRNSLRRFNLIKDAGGLDPKYGKSYHSEMVDVLNKRHPYWWEK